MRELTETEKQLETKGYPGMCPMCEVTFVGEPMPEEGREYYSPPYNWVRVIGVYDRNADRTTHWQCPDCKHEWARVR